MSAMFDEHKFLPPDSDSVLFVDCCCVHVCDAIVEDEATVDAATDEAAVDAAATADDAAIAGEVVGVVDAEANSVNNSVLPNTVGDERRVFKCSVLPLLLCTVRAMSDCERKSIFSPYNGVMPCCGVL